MTLGAVPPSSTPLFILVWPKTRPPGSSAARTADEEVAAAGRHVLGLDREAARLEPVFEEIEQRPLRARDRRDHHELLEEPHRASRRAGIHEESLRRRGRGTKTIIDFPHEKTSSGRYRPWPRRGLARSSEGGALRPPLHPRPGRRRNRRPVVPGRRRGARREDRGGRNAFRGLRREDDRCGGPRPGAR